MHKPKILMIDGEPRISDVDLAQMLGMSVRNVRRLINKRRPELEAVGKLHEVRVPGPILTHGSAAIH